MSHPSHHLRQEVDALERRLAELEGRLKAVEPRPEGVPEPTLYDIAKAARGSLRHPITKQPCTYTEYQAALDLIEAERNYQGTDHAGNPLPPGQFRDPLGFIRNRSSGQRVDIPPPTDVQEVLRHRAGIHDYLVRHDVIRED